ncbi:hypothetical protein EDD86DRAFT_214510 [Gorgonomyces haynaldii]|nr:hypothetical protein EDD86DRAFT_214510 [Gorgonomyces haynaldii]
MLAHEIVQELKPIMNEILIQKVGRDDFDYTKLEQILQDWIDGNEPKLLTKMLTHLNKSRPKLKRNQDAPPVPAPRSRPSITEQSPTSRHGSMDQLPQERPKTIAVDVPQERPPVPLKPRPQSGYELPPRLPKRPSESHSLNDSPQHSQPESAQSTHPESTHSVHPESTHSPEHSPEREILSAHVQEPEEEVQDPKKRIAGMFPQHGALGQLAQAMKQIHHETSPVRQNSKSGSPRSSSPTRQPMIPIGGGVPLTFKKKENSTSGDDKALEKQAIDWMNHYLQHKDLHVTDISKDLGDGLLLIYAIEERLKTSVGKYSKKIILPVHRMDNITVFLQFLGKKGLSTSFINAQDIIDGNKNKILSLFQRILKQFPMERESPLKTVSEPLPDPSVKETVEPVKEPVAEVEAVKETPSVEAVKEAAVDSPSVVDSKPEEPVIDSKQEEPQAETATPHPERPQTAPKPPKRTDTNV